MLFKDLKRIVEDAEKKGITDSDTVMYILESEDGNSGMICSIQSNRIEPQTFTEGSADSTGGTLWLYGKEY